MRFVRVWAFLISRSIQAMKPLLLLLLLLLLASTSVLLLQVSAHEHASKPGVPREKNCKAESPADDGWISQCSGAIRCPRTCPKCHLSCKFCGMIYCPKCNKVGSVCQDPRFIGGDGVTFYFHGERNADFCLVSDAGLQVNAHFIGKRPQGRPRDFTWVQSLGILFGSRKLYVGAKKVATWDSSKDQFLVYFDSNPVSIPPEAGASYDDGDMLKLTRIEATNSLNIHITGMLNTSVTIVPISKEESRVHKYEITPDDCFAHLETNFQFLSLSEEVSGVLGQTYGPRWQTPIKQETAMPTLGSRAEVFKTSSVLSPDCSVSRFRGFIGPVTGKTSRAYPRASCGKGPYGSGFACKR